MDSIAQDSPLYCNRCGKKMQRMWNGLFSVFTGEKILVLACPDTSCPGHENPMCESIGHAWKSTGSFIMRTIVCSRCGFGYPVDD